MPALFGRVALGFAKRDPVRLFGANSVAGICVICATRGGELNFDRLAVVVGRDSLFLWCGDVEAPFHLTLAMVGLRFSRRAGSVRRSAWLWRVGIRALA